MDDVYRVAGVMAQIFGHPPMRFSYNGGEAKNVDVKVLRTGEGLETRVTFEYVEPKVTVDRARFERLRLAVIEGIENGIGPAYAAWLEPSDLDPLP